MFIALCVHADEPPLLTDARRALAESIPQVAIQKLETLRARTDISAADRNATELLLGEALLAAGKHDAVARIVEPLAVAGDAAAELFQAHILAGAGRWAEALPIYERLAKPADAPAAARLGLAESWHATGQTARAIGVLDAFVRENPRATTAQLRLAGLLAEARQAARARAVLASVRAETSGDRLWRRYVEGRLLLLDNHPEEAAAVFAEVTSVKEHLSENLLVAATLAVTDARILLSGAEVADRVLEGFIWKYPDSAYLELVFRRLDQVYATEKNPPEGELQKWAAAPEQRRAALGRFYVARMQLRARKFDRATISTEAFVGRFPEHSLVSFVHIMRADIQIERRQFPNAVLALEAAERQANTEELRAQIELRTGLVHYQQGEYLLAANKFESAARRSPQLRRTAIYDAALATLRQQNYERFFEQYRDLTARYPESELRAELILEEGLLQARTGDPRAEETLQLFLLNFPKHARQSEARLALAELAFQAGDQRTTARYLRAVNEGPRTPQTDEQAEYLAIFFEEKKTPRDDARLVDLARQFVLAHPASPLLAEVRLKLGQVYFRNEDFANAETQFATLAKENPTGPYAENALFLAGQSAMKTINTGALDRALELFDRVVKLDGPLKLYARQQQAIVQSQIGKEVEAIKLYDIILAAEPPAEAELRFAALASKGDNLAILGHKDPQQLHAALAVFDELAGRDAPPTWRNRALYKKGQILMQLGRGADALATYYDVLGRSTAEDREYLWYYKAGFEAARIFEADKQWQSAIGIYEKMAAIEGPRTPEAQKRVKDLRLQHFLWE
jgi:outer membrane protein assembly factor BamD (BamD/ComL family)